MKQLTWKLVLPLTIISFVFFTKWWHVVIFNESHEILTGFPLPYKCPGWHTSLSLQIFVSALIIDILAYFGFWFILFFAINQFIKKINPGRILTIILLSTAGLLVGGMILVGSNPDNVYTFKREFEIEMVDSGYEIIWQKKS